MYSSFDRNTLGGDLSRLRCPREEGEVAEAGIGKVDFTLTTIGETQAIRAEALPEEAGENKVEEAGEEPQRAVVEVDGVQVAIKRGMMRATRTDAAGVVVTAAAAVEGKVTMMAAAGVKGVAIMMAAVVAAGEGVGEATTKRAAAVVVAGVAVIKKMAVTGEAVTREDEGEGATIGDVSSVQWAGLVVGVLLCKLTHAAVDAWQGAKFSSTAGSYAYTL